MRKLLQRAREANVKFNEAKLQFKVSEVKYMGNIVSESGLKPDDEKIRAILEMPVPESKEELQRLLGMVNYFAQFIPNQSTITGPLRQLLKKDVDWMWLHEHTSTVQELKQILSSKPVLNFFDSSKPVKLQVDASKSGRGACLMQDDQPVAYASRSLTSAEENYAQIEKELLAVVFGCERFHCYVYGRSVQVDSGHKPLETIAKKPLCKASPRSITSQRLLLSPQKYEITINYVPGKNINVADTLSRAYLSDGLTDDEIRKDMDKMVHSLVESLPISQEKLAEMKLATARDETLQSLSTTVKDGWPSLKPNVPTSIFHYWNVRDEIHEAEGLLFLGQKLIIPQSLRQDILRRIHESHLGMEKCKLRARAVVYWPGMSADIENMVAKCSICLKYRNQNQKEPLMPHKTTDRPWQKLGTDVFELYSKSYLIIVDYYSKYPELFLLRDKTSQSVITSMKSVFARHGIPDEVIADNMPFSSKECIQFAQEWGFEINTSSPRYPSPTAGVNEQFRR